MAGPHNTVHIDDLARNFAMNPQSGLRISRFSRGKRDSENDCELRLLRAYLLRIARHCPDFQRLDHGRWKQWEPPPAG